MNPVKLSDRWSVLPMYAGGYRGTKGVDDGVGAGTLFQQQMDHTLSVTGIRKIAKPYCSWGVASNATASAWVTRKAKAGSG